MPVEVDPVTGQPKVAYVTSKEQSERYDRYLAQKGKSDELSESLASDQGQLVINKIQEHLLARVNKLMEEDGECRALKRVLVDMGITVSMGELAVRNLTRLLIKK